MNIIERKYRMVNLAEDLQHAMAKVEKVQQGTSDPGEQDRLESLIFYLRQARDVAQRIGCPKTRNELTALLQASIDGRIEEKNLAGAMASALEMEKGHAANVTLFPKP